MRNWLVVWIFLWTCFDIFDGSACLSIQDNKIELAFSNLIPKDTMADLECDRMESEIATSIRKTRIETYPKLAGKWISSGCEIRSGPEFLLRSYTFLKNNTFKLVQFYYNDGSCTLPTYTVTARGHLSVRGSSWITPGGINADYTLTKVTVMPQNSDVAEELSRKINSTCSGTVRRPWRPHREYILYNLIEVQDEATENKDNILKQNHYPSLSKTQEEDSEGYRKPIEEIDCLSSLNLAFHELQLFRVQKKHKGPVNDQTRVELLLGDIHSRAEARDSYVPTAFQVALLRSDQVQGCSSCHLVHRGTERSPPHLLTKPRLPPYLDGTWISEMCEVRPYGLFLTRRLNFDSRDHTWYGTYRFYSDPECRESSFTISADGRYVKGSSKTWTTRVLGGYEFDFRVENAFLTLHESGIVSSLNNDPRCGSEEWTLGVAQDLRLTQGCASLGIMIPTIEHELIKIDMNNMGTPLLLMGDPDTENKKRGPTERPTSYQSPLIQCKAMPSIFSPSISNQLFPVPYARVGARSASPALTSSVVLTIFLQLVYVIAL